MLQEGGVKEALLLPVSSCTEPSKSCPLNWSCHKRTKFSAQPLCGKKYSRREPRMTLTECGAQDQKANKYRSSELEEIKISNFDFRPTFI